MEVYASTFVSVGNPARFSGGCAIWSVRGTRRSGHGSTKVNLGQKIRTGISLMGNRNFGFSRIKIEPKSDSGIPVGENQNSDQGGLVQDSNF